jgi:hypothetical protein
MDEETATAGRAPIDRADVRAALDPHASPVLLASLAEDVPALRPLIATNPSCPTHVLAWLRERGETSIDDGLARNPYAHQLGLRTERAPAGALDHYGTTHCPACGAQVAADAWVCGSCFEPFGAPAAVVDREPLLTMTPAGNHTDAVAVVSPRLPPPTTADRSHRAPRLWPLVLLALLVLAAAAWLVVRKRNTVNIATVATSTTVDAPTTVASTVAATTTAPAPTTTVAPVTTIAAPATAAPPAATTAAPPATTAAPPPTTTAPATTAAPPATTAAPPSQQQAVALAQRLVDAYASGDWATVHKLNPSDPRNDDGLAASYGTLDRAFALATKITATTPSVYNLRLGLVYQLTESGAPKTRLYCVHWDVDVSGPRIERVSGVQLDQRDGTLDPNALKPELDSTCPGQQLS